MKRSTMQESIYAVIMSEVYEIVCDIIGKGNIYGIRVERESLDYSTAIRLTIDGIEFIGVTPEEVTDSALASLFDFNMLIPSTKDKGQILDIPFSTSFKVELRNYTPGKETYTRIFYGIEI